MSEVLVWFERIVSFLPQLIGLWNAARAKDPRQELEASLALVRAMKDRQAREEIGGP